VLVVVGGAMVMAIGVVAFLAQRPPTEPPLAPYAVAKVAEVSTTARPVEVVMRQGADRLLQRERSNFGRCPGTMGCPSSTEMRPVPIFLVRDEGGAVHAFIGSDPRNGCALEWKAIPPDRNWFVEGVRVGAVFYDPCHGSHYDRRGQVIAGPSPWDLNELATEIRDGDLYINPGKILVGECRGCP
jgi:Rieske Fe-S protein